MLETITIDALATATGGTASNRDDTLDKPERPVADPAMFYPRPSQWRPAPTIPQWLPPLVLHDEH